jgi:hypothetical protein
VEHIPQRRVEQHRRGFEDVEEPFVPHDGTQRPERLEVAEVDLGIAHVFDEAVDASDKDNHHADVQGYEDDADWLFV